MSESQNNLTPDNYIVCYYDNSSNQKPFPTIQEALNHIEIKDLLKYSLIIVNNFEIKFFHEKQGKEHHQFIIGAAVVKNLLRVPYKFNKYGVYKYNSPYKIETNKYEDALLFYNEETSIPKVLIENGLILKSEIYSRTNTLEILVGTLLEE